MFLFNFLYSVKEFFYYVKRILISKKKSGHISTFKKII